MTQEKNRTSITAEGKTGEILRALRQEYPNVGTALKYQNPFQLLLAVILSAQTTDKQVNAITGDFFRKVEKPADILVMNQEELESRLKGCGLFRQKSRQIVETSRLLEENYGGEVPASREELMELPGVGRKTANVVLSTAFNVPALAVDTHVRRVSRRLGLTGREDFLKVEEDLCRVIPREEWSSVHHRLIAHGRRYCRARAPLCGECPLASLCSYLQRDDNKQYLRKEVRE